MKYTFWYFSIFIALYTPLVYGQALDTLVTETNFNYLDSKVKLSFESPQDNFTAKVVLRIKKDSIIWASISKTGIEGLRVLLRTDSVYVIDRLGKNFYRYSFKEVSALFKFDLNFEIIQSIIVGNMPFKSYDKNRTSKNENYWKIKQNERNIDIENYISLENKKLAQIFLVDSSTNSNMKLSYENFSNLGDVLFPHTHFIDLVYKEDGQIQKMNIKLEHIKVVIGQEPLKFPFNMANGE